MIFTIHLKKWVGPDPEKHIGYPPLHAVARGLYTLDNLPLSPAANLFCDAISTQHDGTDWLHRACRYQSYCRWKYIS